MSQVRVPASTTKHSSPAPGAPPHSCSLRPLPWRLCAWYHPLPPLHTSPVHVILAGVGRWTSASAFRRDIHHRRRSRLCLCVSARGAVGRSLFRQMPHLPFPTRTLIIARMIWNCWIDEDIETRETLPRDGKSLVQPGAPDWRCNLLDAPEPAPLAVRRCKSSFAQASGHASSWTAQRMIDSRCR